MAKLAIADPPYLGRANRWYGTGRGHAAGRGRPDQHDEAARWDDPATHRDLVRRLTADYDGWALAAAPSSLGIYLADLDEQLRKGTVRLGAWHRGNAVPSGARIASRWEPVIFRIPDGRAAHGSGLEVSDVLTVGIPYRSGFAGRKPESWSRWVFDVLDYRRDEDTLDDLFPGSGAVTAAADGRLAFPAA